MFQRAALLLGEKTMRTVSEKKVILFGVGGVGSWCAEALVRSGIKHLTIVDFDKVCITNINRQLMATSETIGELKVEALKKRLLEINPHASVTAISEPFTETSAGKFHLETFDYIVDAIDSLADKMHLILAACETKAKFFSSMGAARKLNPSEIQVADFFKVAGCPLARALRTKLKAKKLKPAKKFKCVYSSEHIEIPSENLPQGEILNANNSKGSLVHITGIFGFTLAGLIINDIFNTVKSEPVKSE